MAGHMPSWVAGISIGAVNSAIIAGNPPEKRIERLREFWERVSAACSPGRSPTTTIRAASSTRRARRSLPSAACRASSSRAVPPAVFQPQGTPEAISVYDTNPLRRRCSSLSISISSIPARCG